MIHGENLILSINGSPLAASKSCSLSKSSSFIEVAPPTAGDWEAFVPSKKAWSMSSDCLLGTMDAYKALDAAWKAGTALTIRFYDTEYNVNETGTAYIENLNLDAAKGSLAKMSVSLKGSGTLSEYKEEIPKTLELSKQICYEFAEYSGHPIARVSQEQGELYVYSITLASQTICEFYLGGGNLVVIGTDHVLDSVDREQTIYLEEDAYDWGSTNLTKTLAAGTYYILFSTNSHSSFAPKVYKVSI